MNSGHPYEQEGTVQAEKGLFTYKFVKKWGGTRPLCLPVPTFMHDIFATISAFVKIIKLRNKRFEVKIPMVERIFVSIKQKYI